MGKHAIVHVEIPTTSIDGSAKFYAELFDWKISHFPELQYALYETGDGPGGGFAPLDSNGRVRAGEVLVHVSTDDIDATLAKVGQLGGETVVPKTEIPGIGWYGIFRDTSGNRIALFTDGQVAGDR